jgi:hypothetical protein
VKSTDTTINDLSRLTGSWALDPDKTTLTFRTKALWVLPVKVICRSRTAVPAPLAGPGRDRAGAADGGARPDDVNEALPSARRALGFSTDARQ